MARMAALTLSACTIRCGSVTMVSISSFARPIVNICHHPFKQFNVMDVQQKISCPARVMKLCMR